MLYFLKVLKLNRILNFIENSLDIMKIKLAEKEFIGIRTWFFGVIKLFQILYLMWVIVNVITSIWMHFSLEIHSYIIDKVNK